MRQMARTAGSLLVLALLVCACVFAAMTGPARSACGRGPRGCLLRWPRPAPSSRPSSRRTLGSVHRLGEHQQLGLLRLRAVGEPDAWAQLAATQREIGRGLARLPVPLAAGAWSGLVTHLLTVRVRAGPRTFTGTPPQLELVYRNAPPANANGSGQLRAWAAAVRGAGAVP